MAPTRSIWKPLVIGACLLPLMGSNCAPPKKAAKTPEFDTFAVAPARICTNLGLPILHLSWSVKGDGESCLSNVTINGSGVDGNIWATGIQDGRCGNGDYQRELRLSLRDVFGNNIPSSITLAADLTRPTQAGVFVSTETLDSASGTTTAQECQAGTTPGG